MQPSIERLSAIVAAIALAAAQGIGGQDAIAAELNARSVPTLSGEPGTRWHGPAVRRVALTNGVLIGRRRKRALAQASAGHGTP